MYRPGLDQYKRFPNVSRSSRGWTGNMKQTKMPWFQLEVVLVSFKLPFHPLWVFKAHSRVKLSRKGRETRSELPKTKSPWHCLSVLNVTDDMQQFTGSGGYSSWGPAGQLMMLAICSGWKPAVRYFIWLCPNISSAAQRTYCTWLLWSVFYVYTSPPQVSVSDNLISDDDVFCCWALLRHTACC